jgi:hypothetical protein
MSIATTADLEIARSRPLLIPLAAAAACVALADWLFYGWTMGISLPLFLAVLGVAAITVNRVHATRTIPIVMGVIFVAGLLALVEEVSTLSVIVGLLATAVFANVLTAPEARSWQRHLFESAAILFRGPFQLIGDVIGALRHMKLWTPEWLGSLVAWIVPLSVFTLFLALFASANPLIENRLLKINIQALYNLLDVWRIWFWVMIACAIWPLLRRRFRRKPASFEFEPRATAAAASSDMDYLLGVQAVTRSLVLFNALFALQSGLDLTYLWGGASLPDGMTLAEYAHRGAYPLIATALLAAGFVLVAMRPNGPAQQSRLIRPLVLAWTAQNVLLVISSILRLDLYVGVYSLTYLRLAAFIWMGLVAAGLLLILIQIILGKPNSWLLSANAATLALVLYACCFINAPWLVATYNVEHCRELGGKGPNLDVPYLGVLGPQARLVLESHRSEVPALLSAMDRQFPDAREALSHLENWRAWSFRAWRLRRYLANTPDTPPALSNSSKG